jgi:eukaryotic-like serine/threonine-protein kinase
MAALWDLAPGGPCRFVSNAAGIGVLRLCHRVQGRAGSHCRRTVHLYSVGVSAPGCELIPAGGPLQTLAGQEWWIVTVSLTSEQMAELSRLWDESQAVAPSDRPEWLRESRSSSPRVREALERWLSDPAFETADSFLVSGVSQALPELNECNPATGERVGPYRLLRELGRGGMGSVWLAERADGLMRRAVAVKLPHLWFAPRFLERFAREREILASLTHPNIGRLYDAGVTPSGQPYLALEYVDGESLTTYCRQRSLNVRACLALFLQVVDAVRFAHEQHVVHRDLKPTNILVSADGQAHLVDFGIAKLLDDDDDGRTAQLGDGALTPNYASPEQLAGQAVGPQSDVYSLGVLLYELLTGVLPYSATRATRAAIEHAVLEATIPRPSEAVRRRPATADSRRIARQLRGDLDTIVLTALQREPARRFVSVQALGDDLRRCLAGEPVRSRPDSVAYRASRFVQRYRVIVAASLLVMASLGGGMVIAWRSAHEAREQERIAQGHARTSAEVVKFVSELFSANEPRAGAATKTGEMTVKQVLDSGAAHVAASMNEAPRTKLKLLELMGDMYNSLMQSTESVELYRQRVVLARSLHDADPRDLVDALIDYGIGLANSSDQKGALAALNEADLDFAKVETNTADDAFKRGRIDYALSYAVQDSDPDAALRYLERALPKLKLRARESSNYGAAIYGLVEIQTTMGRVTAAMASAEEALQILPADSLARPVILSRVGYALMAAGEFDAGLNQLRLALASHQAIWGDGVHETTAAAIYLSVAFVISSQPEEARRLLMQQVLAIEKRYPDALPSILGDVQALLAEIEVLEGRLDDARRWLDRRSELKVKPGPDTTNSGLGRALAVETDLLLVRGRFKEALQQIDNGQMALQAHGLVGEQYARILRTRAVDAHLGLGDIDSAQAVFERIDESPTAPPDEPPHPRARSLLVRNLLRARLLFDSGKLQEAAAVAADLVERMDAAPNPDLFSRYLVPAETLLGRIDLAAARYPSAAARFDRAAGLRQRYADPESPILAELVGWQGTARLALGQTAQARALADRARTMLRRYAPVAPQYSQPLEALELELARGAATAKGSGQG